MLNKTHFLILIILGVLWANSSGIAQAPSQGEAAALLAGPVSLEPAVEKNGVRVALRTSIRKKDELSVLVKISNLSNQPILVSPDAVETSTTEGFLIPTVGSKPASSNWGKDIQSTDTWTKFSKVASLIPFSDPYKIVSSTYALAQFAGKSAASFKQASEKEASQKGLLHEVILQPGMATHGLIIYDSSSLKAFSYAPTLRIKVTVGEEPFEFKFASRPPNSNSQN